MFLKRVRNFIPLLTLRTKFMLLSVSSTLTVIAVSYLFLYNKCAEFFISYPASRENFYIFCQHQVLAITIPTIFLTLFLSRIISANVLGKLYDLSDKIKEINSSTLQERIAITDLPIELKHVALQFNALMDRLQRSFQHISQFSSDLAHEIRTPLNNIRGQAEIILSYGNSMEAFRDALENNLEEISHLTELVDQLFFISSLENQKNAIKREMLPLHPEIEKVIEYYDALAQDKRVQVQVVGQAVGYVDRILLKRAISNLLSNALRYTKENDKILISLAGGGDAPCTVTVVDTGEGMEAHHLTKIMQRFYRIDSARADTTGGLGLGLAIVKSIMDLHGATVTIDSAKNQGTRVTLQFPAAGTTP